MSAALIETSGLTKRFGGLVAVNRLDLAVEAQAIHAVIGPNGSGKTTVLNLLSGMLAPSAGAVRFAGEPIERQPPHLRVRRGMRRTFQNIRLFNELTVLENVMLGQHSRASTGFSSLFKTWSAQEKRLRREARATAQRLGIGHLVERPAGELAYGTRRLVEIARALASAPKLLLLDEPSAGMNAREAEDLCRIIRGIREEGVTVLLVEHNLKVISRVATRVTAINFGEKIAEGSPSEVLSHKAVVEAYIGLTDAEPIKAQHA
ncbi:MAG: ABC transporter ATP-binding protein [Hyphomicrobiales bacterium]